jgi:DNA-binding winged helix-turn-helix (wHTH) protein/Tol biopolymer transport system component
MKTYITSHWQFSPNRQELVYSDNEVRQLPARLSRCLEALLEGHGKTLLYDELLQIVWGTIHKDSNTIAAVISELRKLINCGEAANKYIITVPKKGYRFNDSELFEIVQSTAMDDQQSNEQPFIAGGSASLDSQPLMQRTPASQPALVANPTLKKEPKESLKKENSVSLGQSSTSAEQNISAVKKARQFTKLHVIFIVVFSIFLTLLITRITGPIFNSNTPEDIHYINHLTHTHDPGRELNFRVSQDKKWLAYVRERQDRKDIVLKNLLQGTVSEMNADVGERFSSPAFSHDARYLAYIHESDDFCRVMQARISPEGWVLSDNRQISDCGFAGAWMNLAYAPHSEALYYAKSDSLSEPYRIMKHDLNTGFERAVTSPSSSGRGDYAFSISPDGQRLAFIRNMHWEDSSVWLLKLKSGETQQVFTTDTLLSAISWADNERLIYASGNDIQTFDLLTLQTQTVFSEIKPLYFPQSIGDSLFLTRGNMFQSDIWHLDLNSFAIDKKVSSDFIDNYPTAGQQQDEIYFMSNRTGQANIWMQNKRLEHQVMTISSEHPIKYLKHLDSQNWIALSDGRLVKIDKSTGKLNWLTSEKSNILSYSLSERRNKLIYANEVDETWFLEQLDVASGDQELLGVQGFTAKYGQDELFITQFRQQGLWRYNASTRQRTLYIEGFESYLANKWAVTEKYILSLSAGKIKIYQRASEQAVLIKEILVEGDPRSISCSESLSRCYFDLYSHGNTEIVELKQQLPNH